jgi:aryl-alcohol dehydrogenase-like predicted oxidoreductase
MKWIDVRDGVRLSAVTMGVNAFHAGVADEIFDRYRALGGASFDTARMYFGGECDKMLGKYINERGIRQDVTVCMKGCYPTDSAKMHVSRLSPGEIRFDLEESLRAFGTDYADLYLLHRDDPRIPVGEIVPTLDALVREGKARAVGVSNWTVGRIQMANEFAKENGFAPLSVSQMHFSLALTTPPLTKDITHVPMNATEEMWYRENDFPIMAFASQGKGYFAQFEAGLGFKATVADYYTHIPENARRAARAVELGKKYGVSASAIALAYVLNHPLKTSALCAYSKTEQYEDSIRALEISLSADEIKYLESKV